MYIYKKITIILFIAMLSGIPVKVESAVENVINHDLIHQTELSDKKHFWHYLKILN